MSIPLHTVLDTAAAGPLRLILRKALEAGESLILDGEGVERAGQACLQVLLAGRDAAGRAGLAFRIDRASPALADMARLAGLGTLLDA